MITPLLRTAFEPVYQRHRLVGRFRTMSTALLLATVGVLALTFTGHREWWAMLGVLIGAAIVRRVLNQRADNAGPDYNIFARDIEAQHPQLHALLLTAVEQRPDPATGKLHFLQQKIISDAVTSSRRLNWLTSVPTSRLWKEGALAVVACVLFLFVLIQTSPVSQAKGTPPTTVAKTDKTVTVNPGDTSLERGSGLVVLANFHRDVPGAATLIIQPTNQPPQRIPLVKNLDDPVFGGGLPEVDTDLTYRVEYAGQATRDFTVTVYEHPRLDRADAKLRYPEYTKLPEKALPDTRRVSAVEGTKLDVEFKLNKPVKSAKLVAKDGMTLPLEVAPDKAVATLNAMPVNSSQTYELKLEDADGRANKLPAQFIIDAVKNRRPELKFQTPRGDQRVSPLEEVAFRAEAWDDFGLARYGLTIHFASGGKEMEQQIELGKDTRADEKKEITHLLKLEKFAVKPDELVSWYLWAEDVGPDGQPRRTETDMFFAEVRPFEEVYRRGDPNEGGEGKGAGAEATKLAELQKQIISATWNLKREEDANTTLIKPAEKYLKDIPVVKGSQEEAHKQATAMAAEIEDPKTRALADNAIKEMQAALEHLNKADTTSAPLPDALTSEQSAYNALLKLAAHEFRVQRSKSKGQQGGQKNQQQLDELEMKDEKQRYETKREAESPQNEMQRDQLAILNRLKELAQRQQDINERLKELQTALQAAKTEKEKEEIQRQLKRLKEEEQQMLADIDETRQRMEQSSQQAQLADERQQLDKTREEAQKTAESMEKGDASKALASGTRTQRDLQQMRDDFRKKTSGQFKEQMRDMRNEARELADRQQEISEKLKPEPGKQERKTLDGSSPREQLAEQFDRQKENLGKITEKMKEVSEQAEAAEPLLAKELYDALRKTSQAATGDSLEKAQILAQRGYVPQAQKFEEKARNEINDLKSGVERAAESVLGDEAEALRQARAELDALKEQIGREIARARPDLADNSDAGTLASQKTSGELGDGQSSQEQGDEKAAGGVPRDGKQIGPHKTTIVDKGDKEADEKSGEQRGPGQKDGQMAGRQPGQGEDKEGNNPGPDGKGKTASQDGSEKDESQQAGQDGKGERGQMTAQNGASEKGDQPGEGKGQRGGAQQGEQSGEGKAQGKGQGDRTAQDSQGQGQGDQPGKGQGQKPSEQSGQGQQPGGRMAQGQQGKGKGQGRGEGSGQGEQGQGQAEGAGQQPGQNADRQMAQNQGQGKGQNQGQGQGRGQNGSQGGANGGDGRRDTQSADRGGDQQGQAGDRRLSQLSGRPQQRGGIRSGSDGGGGVWGGGTEGEQAGPLTGERFTEWSDRLRNVEEMVDDPALRTEVARIREFAKGVRVEFKRHSLAPNWDMVKTKIEAPLTELRNRLTEELARRDSRENLVPIDRDPVPTKYAERVRRYYEDLGRSR